MITISPGGSAAIIPQGITRIIALTQAEYDAIELKDPQTLYVIK